MLHDIMRFTLVFLLAAMPGVAEEATRPASDTAPSLVYLGNEEWLCAWKLKYFDEERPIMSFARSTDNGATWQKAQQPFQQDQLTCSANLKIRYSDNIVSVLGCSKSIVSSDRCVTWEAMPNKLVDKHSSSDYRLSDVVEGKKGAWGLTILKHNYKRGVETEAYAVFSHDGGSTWQEPFHLSTHPQKSRFRRIRWPVLATDQKGNWIAAWYGDEAYYCRRSHDNAHSWTEPVVAVEHNMQEGWSIEKPDIIVSASGCWLMIWRAWSDGGDGPFGPSYVKATRSTDAGRTWEPYQILNEGQENNFSALDNINTATDHRGNWIVVWDARVPDGERVPKDRDICFSVSSDDAHSWSKPRTLNTNASTNVGEDTNCTVATNGEGLWLAAWHSTDTLGGRLGRDKDILYARSTDNGATWSDPEPLNSNISPELQDSHFSQGFNPHLVTDGKGIWLATWSSWGHDLEKHGQDAEVLVTRSEDNGHTWSLPIPANTDAATEPYDDMYPHLAVNDHGVWMLTWLRSDRDLVRHYVAVARSLDKGASWSEPQIISDSQDFFRNPMSAPARNASWAATFSSFNFGGLHIVHAVHSDNDGLSWSKPLKLSGDQDAFYGDSYIAASANLNWLVVWGFSLYRDKNKYLQMRRSVNNKTWDPMIELLDAFPYRPQLFPGSPGHYLLTSVNDYHHDRVTSLHIRSTSDDGRNWSDVKTITGESIKPFKAAYGENEQWIGLFSQDTNYPYDNKLPAPIYLTHSNDNGQTWAPKAPFMAGESPVEGTDAHIVSGRKGNWIIIWQTQQTTKHLTRWKIFASRSNDNGLSWSEPFQLDDRP